jgi:uncharacterized damage-inducible protein DinB
MNMLRLTAVVLAAGLTAMCGGNRESGGTPATTAPAASTAAAPASQVLRDLRTDWQAQKDTMVKIADAMPEAKFGYKSTPPQRNYGEQIMHVALTNVELLKALGGKAAAPAFTAESVKTKADMLKAMADSYDYGSALLDEESEATIGQPLKDAPSFLGPSTRARIYWTLLAHTMDIYGQMAVYLRLNGIVPPASRGV